MAVPQTMRAKAKRCACGSSAVVLLNNEPVCWPCFDKKILDGAKQTIEYWKARGWDPSRKKTTATVQAHGTSLDDTASTADPPAPRPPNDKRSKPKAQGELF